MVVIASVDDLVCGFGDKNYYWKYAYIFAIQVLFIDAFVSQDFHVNLCMDATV